VHRTLPLGLRGFLDTPITEEELKAAVSKELVKSSGRDSMCLGFFKVKCDNIKNDMQAIFNRIYLDGQIMEQQKHGIVLRIHKTKFPTTTVNYEPITLLNTGYKF